MNLVVAYYPFRSEFNKYTELSQSILKMNGCNIVDFEALVDGKIEKADIIILNWYESVYSRNPFKLIKKFQAKINVLKSQKEKGAKIIFTFHNKKPHSLGLPFCLPVNDLIGKINIARMYRMADRIIILSKDSRKYLLYYLQKKDINKKAFYIPHPNYIDAYSHPLKENIYNYDGIFKILFIGAIRPYKNIELILEAAKVLDIPSIRFYIKGAADKEYQDKIMRDARQCQNVEFDFKFIGDAEIEETIRYSDILLIPYDVKSSMNSGTAILAFSNGRSLICPQISTIREIDKDLVYTYDYKSKKEHIDRIIFNIRQAYDDWLNNRSEFEAKGTKLYEYVKTTYSLDELAKRYKLMFDELLK